MRRLDGNYCGNMASFAVINNTSCVEKPYDGGYFLHFGYHLQYNTFVIKNIFSFQ